VQLRLCGSLGGAGSALETFVRARLPALTEAFDLLVDAKGYLLATTSEVQDSLLRLLSDLTKRKLRHAALVLPSGAMERIPIERLVRKSGLGDWMVFSDDVAQAERMPDRVSARAGVAAGGRGAS
jgi:hypothetical protein